MKKLACLSLLIPLFQACIVLHPTKDIKNDFTYCYDGKTTGLDSLIKIDGFYKMGYLYDIYGLNGIREHKIDTTYMNFMFYRDGTFVGNFFAYTGSTEDYLKKVVANKAEKKGFEYGFRWGRYVVDKDIIKVQWINYAPYVMTWSAQEDWYKIIDKNTLRFLQFKDLGSKYKLEEDEFYNAQTKSNYLDAKFVGAEIRPDSNTWLKKEDWFFCK